MAAVSARRRGLAAGLTVAAIVAAAWFGPAWVDWSRFRGRLAAGASAGLDRPVTIAGPIGFLLLPRPTLTAGQVEVADAGDGVTATVGEMRLQVDMSALLAGRVEISDLVLRRAAMRLPWPPVIIRRSPPAWLTRLHARIEDSTLQTGGLAVTRIDGDLSADAVTGTLSASGRAELLGRPWRIGGRLGQVGGDGSATLDVSFDGEGATADTGGTLAGQIAADGTLAGQVRGRGPDLSLLLAAPAVPWRASGPISAGDGMAMAPDLDLAIGGAPAVGAVALHVLPAARIDAALASSRLDLDAWLAAMAHGDGAMLPTGLDLSAEQATLAGGTLRRLRAGFELTPGRVVVREADMVLPGDATLHLDGGAAGGRFRGDARLDAGDLRATLRWLRPFAPALVDALPPGVLHTAALTGDVAAGNGLVRLASLAGRLDGGSIAGELTVRPGEHAALAATLAITGLQLDAWLPQTLPADPADWGTALIGLPRRWSGFDLDLVLDAPQPTWRGVALDAARLDTRVSQDGWEVRHATLQAAAGTAEIGFKLAGDGRLSDGQLAVSLPQAGMLGQWPLKLPPGLQGPATLQASASGLPAALALSAAVEVADARIEASGRADLASRTWSGSIAARHPGAPRLLAALGLPGTAAWLGDGSMSLLAQAAVSPEVFTLKDADLAAGALRATAALTLDLRGALPTLTGQAAAESLPLPLPALRSSEPLPFGALLGWQGRIGVRADQVLLNLTPVLGRVAGDIAVVDGSLRLDGFSAELAGGRLTGNATVAAGAPPQVRAGAALAGAVIDAPLLEAVPVLAAGRVDATATLQATGYSPAALLATLAGTAAGTVRDGVLSGVDLAAAAAALGQDDPQAVARGIAQALDGGATGFGQLDFVFAAEHGAITLRQAALTASSGAIDIAGLFDLSAASEDLRLSLQPRPASPLPSPPRLELRLTGAVAHPQRASGVADLTRFLAERRPTDP